MGHVGSFFDIPIATFYLLKGDYNPFTLRPQGLKGGAEGLGAWEVRSFFEGVWGVVDLGSGLWALRLQSL